MEHYIQPSLGQPLDMYSNLPKATANVISQLVFAKRFDYEDAAFTAITNVLNSLIRSSLKMSFLGNLPIIGEHIPVVKKLRTDLQEISLPTIRKCIEERRQQFSSGEPQCLVDQYLLQGGNVDALTGL